MAKISRTGNNLAPLPPLGYFYAAQNHIPGGNKGEFYGFSLVPPLDKQISRLMRAVYFKVASENLALWGDKKKNEERKKGSHACLAPFEFG